MAHQPGLAACRVALVNGALLGGLVQCHDGLHRGGLRGFFVTRVDREAGLTDERLRPGANWALQLTLSFSDAL